MNSTAHPARLTTDNHPNENEHFLLSNKSKGNCYLCNLLCKRKTTHYGCTECQRFFCVDCFALTHSRGFLGPVDCNLHK